MEEEGKQLAVIPRNSTEQIQISVKSYKNKDELFDWVLSYVEARHGIFERLKRKAAEISNNTK